MFKPIKVLVIDIEHPIPNLACRDEATGREYFHALILVRLHTYPVGIVEVDIPPNGLSGDELAMQIWGKLKSPIQEHLAEDNIVLSGDLNQAGLRSELYPLCLQKYRNYLETLPFVSVVIATRDRVTSLQECLKSVFAQDYPGFEVIVVDNAPSSDETEKYIQSAFAESAIRVKYLREDVPGLAVAHNRALAEVTSPIVAITDDDVVVDRNWLMSLVVNFQHDPSVACVTGMILPYELETPTQLWIEQFGGFGKGYKQIKFDMRENRPQDFLFPYSAGRFGSGANMAFRVDMLKAIGGFDPALGAGTFAKGGDDLAAFFDVVTNGYRLIYEPRAILYHKHRQEYPGLARQAHGYGVGLSAFLMKTILDKPTRLFDMILKIPVGLKYILDPRSPKNQKKQVDYPHELTQLELRGFLIGPFLFIRSRWHAYRIRKLLPKFRA